MVAPYLDAVWMYPTSEQLGCIMPQNYMGHRMNKRQSLLYVHHGALKAHTSPTHFSWQNATSIEALEIRR